VTATIGSVAAQVVFAGPQSQFVGLDQVNVIVPASLRSRGTLDARVSAAGATSHVVSIAIQ
jgi:uncharacterized protein (TIGR03437 family)